MHRVLLSLCHRQNSDSPVYHRTQPKRSRQSQVIAEGVTQHTTGKSIFRVRLSELPFVVARETWMLFPLWWMWLSARGEMVILIILWHLWPRSRWITSQRTPGGTRHHNNWRVGSMVLKRSWKPPHCASDDGSIPLLSARHSVERFGLLITQIKTPLT